MSADPKETELNLNPHLSDYEKLRARNVVRNNACLRSLGLISVLEEKRSNAVACGQSVSSAKENSKPIEACSKSTTVGKNKKRKAQKAPKTESFRKSGRLQGLEPEGCKSLPEDQQQSTSKVERRQQRLAIVEECRLARQRAALRVMEAGAEKAAKENPTATYEHCLMRVRTMTDTRLINRVKAIERATGKHCVVKMGKIACPSLLSCCIFPTGTLGSNSSIVTDNHTSNLQKLPTGRGQVGSSSFG